MKVLLKSSKKTYIVEWKTDTHYYCLIEKNGKPYGRIRGFKPEQIEII